MKRFKDWLTHGWRVLEVIHTGVWAFGLLSLMATSALPWILASVSKQEYVGPTMLVQFLVWAVIAVSTVAYIGFKARGFEESPVFAQGVGGAGGSVRIVGNNAVAIAGRGGRGGTSGSGGDGGGADVQGDNAFAVAGDGGDAGTADGRGGQGARSPIERMGGPTHLWPFGRGGSGANAPEYDRRLDVLARIRNEYRDAFPDEVPFVDAGVDPVPIHWVNKRLEEIEEAWRVSGNVAGYQLPSL